MSGIIYVFTNKITGKQYVGQTINFKQRLYSHKCANTDLGKDIRLYGLDKFNIETVEVPKELMNDIERKSISKLNTVADGYNKQGDVSLRKKYKQVRIYKEDYDKLKEICEYDEVNIIECLNDIIDKSYVALQEWIEINGE